MRPSRAGVFQEERGRGLVRSGLESRLDAEGSEAGGADSGGCGLTGPRARGWGRRRAAPQVSDPHLKMIGDQQKGPRLPVSCRGWGRPFPIISLPCEVCSPLAYTIISVSQQRWGAFFKTICR